MLGDSDWLPLWLVYVCLGDCVWAMISWCIFISYLWELTVDAVTSVLSGSPLGSQIFTITCFLFFLSRAHWGMIVFISDWLGSIREGVAKAEHQPFFIFFNFLQKALMALNHQEKRSSRQVQNLNFEHWITSRHSCAWQCYCETGERRVATVCTCIQLWKWYFCYIEKQK